MIMCSTLPVKTKIVYVNNCVTSVVNIYLLGQIIYNQIHMDLSMDFSTCYG